MITIACIIIATERRRALVETRVLPSVSNQGFDEVVLVADWQIRERDQGCYRHQCVEPMLRNTIDALVKRDVGALMTKSDVLVYLCDDHVLAPNFLAELRKVIDEEWDVIVPNRFCRRADQGMDDFGNVGPANSHTFHHPAPVTALSNGERDGYCGGHGGVFRRSVIQARPWAAHSHTPYWDARSSFAMRLAGARFVWKPRAGIAIEDIEPNATPWK